MTNTPPHSRSYLDHNATFPLQPEHWAEVASLLFAEDKAKPGNPSSLHAEGRRARELIEAARRHLAVALGVEPQEIVLTSSATEANNMVIQAAGRAHALSTSVEHPSVAEPLRLFSRSLSEIPPLEAPEAFLSALIGALRPDTSLVTVIGAQNETGQIFPVKAFGDWLHAQRFSAPAHVAKHKISASAPEPQLPPSLDQEALKRLHFHVDATQLLGKIPADQWMSPGIDSIGLSGHKVGGLHGTGALMLRRGRPMRPLLYGGKQERGRRAGTENLPGIISLGLRAQAIMRTEYWDHVAATRAQARELEAALRAVPHLMLLSDAERGLPSTVHAVVASEAPSTAEDLLIALDLAGVAASSGSACSSAVGRPSAAVAATLAARQNPGSTRLSELELRHLSQQALRFSLPIVASPEHRAMALHRISEVLATHLDKVRSNR